MVNKQLMGKEGYGFNYATTLCGVHFVMTSLSSLLFSKPEGKDDTSGKLPLVEAIGFVVIADVSIVSMNISLMLNSVGFYQICKLLVIPTICCIDYFALGKKFTSTVLATIGIVLAGVGVATVTDVQFNEVGAAVAILGVVSTASQQALIGHLQHKHNMEPHQLIGSTAPAQAVSMLVLGPFIDRVLAGSYPWTFQATVPSMVFLLGSCVLAALVNLTQYFCIGRLSAVSFQVLGHTKTVGVLFFGWFFFNHETTLRNLLGLSLAVVGMVAYGIVTQREKAAAAAAAPVTPPSPKKAPPEKEPEPAPQV
eukprot:CAMPEP_0197845984 /NCGR_PEP_ID=MMETSP1438-20131217/2820_1 /TAXON_ID=1461541 /ORGANISM="Pterosperma sp., Strain CCMP1384" /LENGTH=308 /DNA_ID=CAMNT_0043457475 /DNA_START=212 /DNA_END=1138 /DNA_ORIENTATION=+